METVRWALRRWNSFWFQEQTPHDLAIGRIVFFGGVLLVYPVRLLSNDDVVFLPRWGDVPQYFFHPIPLFDHLGIPVLPFETLWILEWIFYIALLTACFGLAGRFSAATAFLLGLYLWGLPQNFGKVYHTETIPLLVMGILACSRSCDVLSVDSALRLQAAPSGSYRWPIRLIWVLFVLCFVAAGVSKLTIGGWEWLTSEQMRWNVIAHHYNEYDLAKWPLFGVNQPGFSQVFSWMTVVAEIAAPLLLVGPRTRAVLAITLVLMQFGIWLLMGIPFTLWLVTYLWFVPWSACWTKFRHTFAEA